MLTASDGPSALRLAGAHPSAVHLLLTDIMMPNGNGIALAKAFRAKWPETPVLYMSGFEPETLELVQTGAAPAGPFLTKPFTPKQLLDQVRKVLALIPTDAVTSERIAPESHTVAGVYNLERPVRCPQCGEPISTLKAIRLQRTEVNFISTLPRRGHVAVCPECLAVLPAELTNF